jgi:hypothetical protein
MLCRPSPELPFYFVWFLGWSTRHLALDPSSVLYACTYNTSYVRISPLPLALPPQRHHKAAGLGGEGRRELAPPAL